MARIISNQDFVEEYRGFQIFKNKGKDPWSGIKNDGYHYWVHGAGLFHEHLNVVKKGIDSLIREEGEPTQWFKDNINFKFTE